MINAPPVILCGGSGTRLWPLSRTGFPKQFLCLRGNESLFQQAAQGLAALLCSEHIQMAAPDIVSGENHSFLATVQLRDLCITANVHRRSSKRTTYPAISAAQDGLV